MAITVNEQTDNIIVEINQGHLDQLKKAQERWNFLDLQGFIGYALGIVCVHEGDAIEILVNDKLKRVYPQGHLLKDKEATELKNKVLKNQLDNLMKDFNGMTLLVISNDEDDEDEYRSKMKNE